MYEDRGTGRTTAQLRGMLDGGLFIWCTSDLFYVRKLCQAIGGSYNIQANVWTKPSGAKVYIRPRSVLGYPRVYSLAGITFTQFVIDHALTNTSYEERDAARRLYQQTMEHNGAHT